MKDGPEGRPRSGPAREAGGVLPEAAADLMRVQPSIAIVAGLGVLALGLLFAWSWFDSDPGPANPEAGTQTPGGSEIRSAGARGSHDPGIDEAGAATRSVGGSLVDDESGPLAEGRIDLWCDDGRLGSRVRVEADGTFVGPACSGRTCARLVHPMFEQPEAWELEPGVMRELVVARSPGLLGTVVSTIGEPIPSANFLLTREQLRATARSDVDGSFGLALARERPCDACDRDGACRVAGDRSTADLARLLVWAPGFAPLELEVALGHENPLHVVLMPPAPPITGRVIGPDGRPIGLRTVVHAINREREAERHAAAVDADGSFSFADLADADYRIRAIRDGHELVVLDRAVPGEQLELRVERELVGRDLHVEVRDDEDQPTSGARVDGGPFRGDKTDAAGRVEAHEVLPGSYTLSVRVLGCSVVRTVVEVGPGPDTAVHELVRLPVGCVTSGPE
jgi:hypothetical protein